MSDELRSSMEPAGPRRRGMLIALAIGGLLLCCCATAAVGWFFGDTILATLQEILQLQ